MQINKFNHSTFQLPEYATVEATGFDLRAYFSEAVQLKPLQQMLMPKGESIEMPECYETQIRLQSGLAIKHDISIGDNSETIDPDCRSEIKTFLINLSDTAMDLQPCDQIAQMITARFEHISRNLVDSFNEIHRGSRDIRSHRERVI